MYTDDIEGSKCIQRYKEYVEEKKKKKVDSP